jgi:hypothetical protein
MGLLRLGEVADMLDVPDARVCDKPWPSSSKRAPEVERTCDVRRAAVLNQ